MDPITRSATAFTRGARTGVSTVSMPSPVARLWNGDVSVRQIVSDLPTEVNPLLEPRLQ